MQNEQGAISLQEELFLAKLRALDERPTTANDTHADWLAGEVHLSTEEALRLYFQGEEYFRQKTITMPTAHIEQLLQLPTVQALPRRRRAS